ncbi:hypothetical protein EJ04DRAFT_579818 [Polyplosphaeria fusca]|uniref:Zn(2)-C6 fungal-type domain-containing protein n=1 Tax=Polyplosphaeria fusca TaxID=682080 RepID=A0A9P4QQ77_9PLEO|nr:hypothetical protein EJ04DRAFT_579818 [Polyplosphaeria fusca]
MARSTSNKGCWTCKDRKIACDKRLPSCMNCARSGRPCQGYGMRLSWPRSNDRKRAMISKISDSNGDFCPSWLMDVFVNVYTSDIELSQRLVDTELLYSSMPHANTILENPRWTPFMLNREQVNLFEYYERNVAKLLTAAGNPHVQSLMMRSVFTDSTPASYAILYAIYALSCLHLSDIVRAIEYKTKAYEAVQISASNYPDTKSVLQRIIAVNFLALYESYASTVAAEHWAASVCYSKTAAIATFCAEQSYQGDLALILDWVYYYDTLAKFSVRHFDRSTMGALLCAKKKHIQYAEMNSPDKTYIVPTIGCSLEVLSAISAILDTALDYFQPPSESLSNTFDKLERRLKFARQDLRINLLEDASSPHEYQRVKDIAELYRLAGLVYLHRAGRGTATTSYALQTIIDEAFAIMQRLDTCNRTFPLFIISCEARTEAQRAVILGVVQRNAARPLSANTTRVWGFVERFWAQDDLDTEQEVDYAAKITAALSRTNSLPAFV